MGRAAAIEPPVENTIRSTERQFLDLTAALAVFNDDYTLQVSVTSSGGVMTANCWNDNTIGDGETETQVLRDLQDHFYIETIGATDGTTAGTLSITGTLLTGGLETLTYEYTVDDFPTTINTDMGNLTLPGFGGLYINDELPGTASGWTIKSDPSGLFTIRNNTGSGGTQYRLVLAGTVYSGLFNIAVPSAPLALLSGTTLSVVLQHAGQADRTISFEVIANQFDVASWSHDTTTSTTGNQAVIFWGHYNPKAAPATGDMVCMCRNGTYSTGASIVCNAITNTGTFPTTNQPTAPYEGGSWAYSGYLKPSSGWITMKSESPLGAVFTNGVALDMQFMNDGNACAGIRITNIATTAPGSSGITITGKIKVNVSTGTKELNTVMIDHCDCYGLQQNDDGTAILQGRFFFVQNRYRSTVTFYGYDCQEIGGVWLNNAMYTPGLNQYSLVTATISDGAGGAGKVLNVTDVSAQTTPLRVGSAVYPVGGTVCFVSAMSPTGGNTGTGGLGTYTVTSTINQLLTGVACKTFPTDLGNGAQDQIHFGVQNETPGSGHCRIAFPTFIGGKMIAALHCDTCQYDGPVVGTAATVVDSILGYGFVMLPGAPYVYTANDIQGVADPGYIGLQAPQGAAQFFHDIKGTVTSITFKMSGNVLVNSSTVGTTIDKPSASVILKNNMYLNAISITNPSDGAAPQIKFQTPTATSGTGITVKDNISTVTGIGYTGSWPTPVTDNGNVWNISSSDQTTNLTQPDIGAAATSRSKAIQAMTPKVTAASSYLTKGPYFNAAKIDLWRQTADDTWIQDAT